MRDNLTHNINLLSPSFWALCFEVSYLPNKIHLVVIHFSWIFKNTSQSPKWALSSKRNWHRITFPCFSLLSTTTYPGNYSTDNKKRTLEAGRRKVDWLEALRGNVWLSGSPRNIRRTEQITISFKSLRKLNCPQSKCPQKQTRIYAPNLRGPTAHDCLLKEKIQDLEPSNKNHNVQDTIKNFTHHTKNQENQSMIEKRQQMLILR